MSVPTCVETGLCPATPRTFKCASPTLKSKIVGQFELVLKGRGFSRAVSCAKSNAALQLAEKTRYCT
jgi:hypothetical protein